jgi:hypothetical protein
MKLYSFKLKSTGKYQVLCLQTGAEHERACLGELAGDHNPCFDREFKLFSRTEVTLAEANIFDPLLPAKTPFSAPVKSQPQKFHSENLTSV